jgi:hypothetical protein
MALSAARCCGCGMRGQRKCSALIRAAGSQAESRLEKEPHDRTHPTH